MKSYSAKLLFLQCKPSHFIHFCKKINEMAGRARSWRSQVEPQKTNKPCAGWVFVLYGKTWLRQDFACPAIANQFLTKLICAGFITCFSIASSAMAGDPINVGVLACLSGGCAEWGSNSKNGLLIAQEKINSAGGVLGRKIELKFEDTNEATAASDAVTAFRKLQSSGNIKFYIGPTWTPAGLALAPVAGKISDIIMISPSLGVAEFNESAPNLFNTMMHSETATRKLAGVARNHGWKRAAVFSSQQPWENLQGRVFRDEFIRLGGEVVAFLDPNPDLRDLRTESLKIVSTKPDGIFLANMNQEGIAAKQLRSLGYTGPMFSALLDQTRIDEAAGGLEGTISAQSPEAQPSFVSEYTAKFGAKPPVSADTAHDALLALAKAIIAVGSTDSLAVREALLKVQFDGASGPLRFDEKGGVIREPALVQVSNNALTPYTGDPS